MDQRRAMEDEVLHLMLKSGFKRVGDATGTDSGNAGTNNQDQGQMKNIPQESLTALAMEVGAFPAHLVVEVEDPIRLDLADIGKGLLLVFARWSPFPTRCLERMRGFVPKMLTDAGAKLYIVDNDKLSATAMQRLFGTTLHRAGETFGCM